jgi:hypothetical protein
VLVLVLLAGCGSSRSLPETTTAKDRAAWRAILRWPESCERSWDGTPGAGVGSWRAGGGRLVGVDCTLGAYQGTSLLYLVGAHRSVAGPLRVSIYRDLGAGVPTAIRTSLVLGTLSFAHGRLSVVDKARGVGDCGIYTVFELADGRLQQVDTRAKTSCDGKPPYDPARWPRLPLLCRTLGGRDFTVAASAKPVAAALSCDRGAHVVEQDAGTSVDVSCQQGVNAGPKPRDICARFRAAVQVDGVTYVLPPVAFRRGRPPCDGWHGAATVVTYCGVVGGYPETATSAP